MNKPQWFLLVILLLLTGGVFWLWNSSQNDALIFSGERAYEDVQRQVDFGPRIPGSKPHQATIDWSIAEFEHAGWKATELADYQSGHQVRNIVAKKGNGSKLLIIGAHYDTRMVADQESPATQEPVPGANDGASGVAVLTELARSVEVPPGVEVWLVMFDAEDQGDLYGWDWILGSTAFAESLQATPDAVVVVDMIGDSDLNLRKERTGDQKLTDQLWNIARDLGYGKVFIDEPGYGMIDDHTPFLQKGFTAVDIIDFDYPYWHTLKDTPDHVSAASLESVGRTLEMWIENFSINP